MREKIASFKSVYVKMNICYYEYKKTRKKPRLKEVETFLTSFRFPLPTNMIDELSVSLLEVAPELRNVRIQVKIASKSKAITHIFCDIFWIKVESIQKCNPFNCSRCEEWHFFITMLLIIQRSFDSKDTTLTFTQKDQR